MKNLLILITSLFLCSLNAQSNYTIKGKVTNENDEPLGWATIVIYNLKDTSLIVGDYSNEAGAFEISTDKKDCLLTISYAGAGNYSKPLSLEQNITDLGKLQLTNSVVLDEVEVKAQKLELSYKNGTLAYAPKNIYQDNSLDFLKTVPLLMTDRNENLLIKGSQAKVLINGRDLRLTGEELKSYLKTLPPDQILKVEVITNPSAKYEAQGSAGILNIILKEKQKGFFGSVYSNLIYNERWSTRLGGGVSYFSDKFGFSANLRNSHTNGFNRLTVTKNHVDDPDTDPVFSDLSDSDLNQNFLIGKVSMNYFIDDKNTISAFFKGYNEKINFDTEGNSTFSEDATSFLTTLNSDNKSDNFNYVGGVDYKKIIDTSGTTLNLEYLYLDVKKDNDIDQTIRFFENQIPDDDFAIRSFNKQLYNIHAVKGDITYPVNKKITLETGVKYSNVVNKNNLIYDYDISDQAYIFAPIESNKYNYKEDIYAFYLSGNMNLGKVNLNAGNRVEYTRFTTEMDTESNDEKRENNYFNFFPNLAVAYTSQKGNSISFSYGRRLNRPNYNDLNPSILYATQYIYTRGNPLLRPEYSNNFEIGIKTGKVITSLFANLIEQPIGQYVEQNDGYNTLFVINENLDNSKVLGILSSYNIDLTSKAALQISATGKWQQTTFGDSSQELLTANINASLNYQISDAISINWSSYYSSPFLYGLYKVQSQFINNAGATFQKNSLSVSLSVRDIFKAGLWDSKINSETYINRWVNRWPTGVVNLSVRYQFGNKKAKAKGKYKGKTSNSESDRIN